MATGHENTLCTFLQQRAAGRQRALLVLSGPAQACRDSAAVLVRGAGQVAWIGADHPGAIPASQARQLLGGEQVAVVYDAHAGLHPDALAAVCGTIVAGGALVLLTPPLDSWPDRPDPDYARLASYPVDWQTLPRRFIARFRDLLAETVAAGCALHLEAPDFTAITAAAPAITWPVLSSAPAAGQPSGAQQQRLEALLQHGGITALLAGRGHGKSALLGFAASQWQQRGLHVLLVAPSRSAAVAVFRHAGGELPFSAPDMLLQDETVTADVLLVDEAAAIPLPLLLDLLKRFPHAVLATTTDGYEGTGQGFVLRFLRELDQQFPGWQSLAVPAPVRWAEGDPLEAWLYRTLLLDAQEPVLNTGTDLSAPVFEWVAQATLASQPALLADIYGLLRSAHYRTTPDDLRFLLDAPGIALYRLVGNAQTVAVALVVEEGSIDAVMAAEIAADRRRPRGHLLVQTMAIHEQQAQFLQQRVARVVRIAVHTSLQGRGLGSQLLQAIVADQRERGVQAIGSSFSATPDVLAFWQRNGFALVRTGHKRQAASAAPSAVVLRLLPQAGGWC